MNLKNQTTDAWLKKSNKELRELISQGVQEINKRDKSITSKLEKEYVNKIKNMQGTTKTGNIRRTAYKLSHRELVYRARIIDQFLDVDTSSKEFNQKLKASYREAKNTFNSRYKMKLSDKEYADMVELMGAFKDQTQGFGSSQIAEFYSYAKEVKTDLNELPKIFGEAVQLKGVSEHNRMEYIFDRIDMLSNM